MVTALNAETKEITITTRGRDSKTITIDASAADFRRYSPDSVRFADAKPSSFADIAVGRHGARAGRQERGRHASESRGAGFGSFRDHRGYGGFGGCGHGRSAHHQSEDQEAGDGSNQSEHLAAAAGSAGGDLAGAAASSCVLPPVAGLQRAGGGGTQAAKVRPRRAWRRTGPVPRRIRWRPRRPGRRWRTAISSRSWNACRSYRWPNLKKGDAVIVSSSKSPGGAPVTAFSFVAGVEPFLAAAPRTAGEVNLGSWNLDLSGGGAGAMSTGCVSGRESRIKARNVNPYCCCCCYC